MNHQYEVVFLDHRHTHGLTFGVYKVTPTLAEGGQPLRRAVALCFDKATARRICELLNADIPRGRAVES